MAEKLICNIDKRVTFPRGEQGKFLLKAKEKTGFPWVLFFEKIGVQKRTFNDWRRGKYSLPLSILKKICALADTKLPVGIKIREPFWYIRNGAKAGGVATYRKYGRVGGDQKYRKKKWREWWEKDGKFKINQITSPKPIFEPSHCEDLAEFVGIMLGDGGMSKRQVIVTLNYKTDKSYSIFVANMIRRLFQIEPSIYNREDESVVSIVVSRTRLVLFCKALGLKIGNKLKQNLDIPRWVMKNKVFRIACVRGLVDTDGCVFQECHKINNKKYCYPRLIFTSYSKLLRASVVKILEDFGFSPRMRAGRNVQLENRAEIIKYFKLIGTNNYHHIKRFKLFCGGVGSGYPKRF